MAQAGGPDGSKADAALDAIAAAIGALSSAGKSGSPPKSGLADFGH
jgi:hypothetical protein